MPTVSDETAVAFQELFRRYTGQHVTVDQARDHAENLIRLVNFVLEREPRE